MAVARGEAARYFLSRLNRFFHRLCVPEAAPRLVCCASPMGFLHEAAHELVSVCIPSACVGCGRWDYSVCPRCAALSYSLLPQWELLDAGSVEYPLWQLSDYSDPMRSIILAAKHSSRLDLSEFLFGCGVNIGLSIAQSGMLSVGSDATSLWVVPAPASWKRRLFGQGITIHVARGVAAAVGGHSEVACCVRDACRLDPWVSSQAGKSSEQRRQSRRGRMYMTEEVPRGVGVIGVDDVVASGGTMNEMFRVFESSWVAGACIARSRQ